MASVVALFRSVDPHAFGGILLLVDLLLFAALALFWEAAGRISLR